MERGRGGGVQERRGFFLRGGEVLDVEGIL